MTIELSKLVNIIEIEIQTLTQVLGESDNCINLHNIKQNTFPTNLQLQWLASIVCVSDPVLHKFVNITRADIAQVGIHGQGSTTLTL